MNVKKYMALFLSLILLCGCLTACGEDATDDGANNVNVSGIWMVGISLVINDELI